MGSDRKYNMEGIKGEGGRVMSRHIIEASTRNLPFPFTTGMNFLQKTINGGVGV